MPRTRAGPRPIARAPLPGGRRPAFHLAPTLEHQQRRDAARAEALCDGRGLVDVDLEHLDAAGKTSRQVLDGRSHHPARAAPRRPQVDEDRHGARARRGETRVVSLDEPRERLVALRTAGHARSSGNRDTVAPTAPGAGDDVVHGSCLPDGHPGGVYAPTAAPERLFPRWDDLVMLGLPAGAQGVLPCQLISEAIELGYVNAGDYRVQPAQVQPASLDLRLGDRAYRLRCSFLPDADPVDLKMKPLVIDELDLRDDGAVLELNRPPGRVHARHHGPELPVRRGPARVPGPAVPRGRAAVVRRAGQAGPRPQ